MVPGSVTFKQKWADFRTSPGSSQYHVMVKNIEKSIREAFKNDSNFQNVTVTQLRAHEATKRSTVQGNLAADFELSFNNQSRARSSVYHLFRVVQSGALDGIPVKEGSLSVHGMGSVLRKFSVSSPTPSQHTTNMPVFRSIWPSGSYGLPKPSSGCPDNNWTEGFRYQDSENVENTNLKSNGSHLSGTVNQHGVRQEFCLHLDTHEERIPWPRGKYCIYRKGRNCPVGLHEGWIRWDDENTKIDFPNSQGGELPDGIYGENTVIYFCCSISGRKSAAIYLPYKTPFYLIAYGSPRCQQVRYHKVTSEYLQFDDEDQANSNSHSRISPYGAAEDAYNNRIYYCYYEPIPCDVNTDAACPNQDSLSTEMHETVKVKIVPKKATRASKFMTGGGVGMLLMGSASVAVLARRFITRSQAT